MTIELTRSQFEIFDSDMELEYEDGNVYMFDISYLAQKVVGHDVDLFCDAYVEIIDKCDSFIINVLSITCDGIDNDNDIELIRKKTLALIKSYEKLEGYYYEE